MQRSRDTNSGPLSERMYFGALRSDTSQQLQRWVALHGRPDSSRRWMSDSGHVNTARRVSAVAVTSVYRCPDVSMVAATYSTVSGQTVRHLVEDHYNVGSIASCHLLNRGLNDVYLLETASANKLVGRLSPIRYRGGPNIEFEAALTKHLHMTGTVTASMLETSRGSLSLTLDAIEGPRVFALFDHLSGEPPSSLAEIELLGEELARLHHRASGYRGPKSRYTIDQNHLFDRPLAQILSAPTMTPHIARRLSAIAGELREQFESLTSDLTRGYCHGDCHGENTYVLEDQRIGFFDFDDSGPGYPIYDLAVYLWALGGRKPTPCLDTIVMEKWKRFIHGYSAVRSLRPQERTALPVFVSLRHIWWLGEYASRLQEWGLHALSERTLSATVAQWNPRDRHWAAPIDAA